MSDFLSYVMQYVKPELLILIPVLYFIGIGLKKVELPNKFIPMLLGVAGILLSVLYIFSTSDISSLKDITGLIFASFTQGILTAGCSVYINQLIKQYNKSE